jgi:hypothetical protein
MAMSMTASDLLRNADTFRRAYPSWPHPEPEERAMTDYDEIKVSAMVTVTLTPEQAQAYADEHGNALVSLEIRARLGAEMTEALQRHPWLRDHMSLEISKPVIVKG